MSKSTVKALSVFSIYPSYYTNITQLVNFRKNENSKTAFSKCSQCISQVVYIFPGLKVLHIFSCLKMIHTKLRDIPY